MKINVDCEIAAPKEKVFEVFSDLEGLAKNVTAITKMETLTEGEIGVGTRFKETRVMFGSESSEEMEIVEFVPNERIKEEARSGGAHYISEWSFSERKGVTTVSVEFSATAISLWGNLMSPLLFFMAGSMKKAFLTDMEELKKVIEA